MINECGCNSGESEMSKDDLFNRLNAIYSELGKLLQKVPAEKSGKEDTEDKLAEHPPVVFVRNFESFSEDREIVDRFSSISVGDLIRYKAKKWKVTSNNGYVLYLEDALGNHKSINRSQFKQYGSQIRD